MRNTEFLTLPVVLVLSKGTEELWG